jgi:hypothetical protein
MPTNQGRTTIRDQSPQDEEEDFDLENVSGSDSDNDPMIAPAPTHAAINPVAQVVNDPEQSSTKKNSNAAQDVWHFFVKADGYSVCQVCKYVTHA